MPKALGTAIGVAFANATVSLALCGVVALYYLHPGRPPARG